MRGAEREYFGKYFNFTAVKQERSACSQHTVPIYWGMVLAHVQGSPTQGYQEEGLLALFSVTTNVLLVLAFPNTSMSHSVPAGASYPWVPKPACVLTPRPLCASYK
jgi:hypothetical protein